MPPGRRYRGSLVRPLHQKYTHLGRVVGSPPGSFLHRQTALRPRCQMRRARAGAHPVPTKYAATATTRPGTCAGAASTAPRAGSAPECRPRHSPIPGHRGSQDTATLVMERMFAAGRLRGRCVAHTAGAYRCRDAVRCACRRSRGAGFAAMRAGRCVAP